MIIVLFIICSYAREKVSIIKEASFLDDFCVDKEGGLCFFTCSNQECHLFEGHGKLRLKLPKSKVSLSMGRYPVSGKLMEVNVIPDNGCFSILVTFDTAASVPEPAGKSVRIAAVDL